MTRTVHIDKDIERLLNKDEDVIHENANKDANLFNTQRDLLAGTVARDYSSNKLLPEDIAKADTDGLIHWHDADYSPLFPMYNCMLIDFKSMFEKGFTIGNADVETPKSIKTACALISQIVANVASNIYGGTSFHRMDEVLEVYAKKSYNKYLTEAGKWIEDKDKQVKYAKEHTKKEIYDSMQSLEYEINTLFSSNGQTPFFTINFGLGTSWFAREIQKSILKVRLDGLGKDKKTAVFPKLVFTLKRGVNLHKDDINYDIKRLAMKCSAKRIYPDYLSYDRIVDLLGYFVSPMGCRSFLPYFEKNGEPMTYGRRNMGVVTLNIPRIALDSRGDKTRFWSILDDRMNLMYRSLMFRVSTIKRATPKNAPILYEYGASGHYLSPDDDVMSIMKNGEASISIGYVGLYEATALFYGSDWQESNNKEAKQFSIDIMKKIDEYKNSWIKKTGYGFSIYGTPSESLVDKFCRADKKHYGIVKDVTDKGYYTNSFHWDSRKKVDPFHKFDFESDYEPYTTGGFIHYCECPSLVNNIGALETIIDYAYDKVGYFGVNQPIDHCYKCGFSGEFTASPKGFECPQCGNHDPETVSCIRRLCGYLGNVMKRKPITGRYKEIKHRAKDL